eukprot:11199260-Alexandrium_andersonii.AAC.1
MSASLVGSEMCIRDSCTNAVLEVPAPWPLFCLGPCWPTGAPPAYSAPVRVVLWFGVSAVRHHALGYAAWAAGRGSAVIPVCAQAGVVGSVST